MRYTTQDRGQIVEVSGVAAFPDLAAPDAPLKEDAPAVIFVHPTMGYADQCAPSKGLEGAAAALLPAAMGFIAAAPDLLGMCGYGGPCPEQFHPYLVGEPTAIASADALRAALELQATVIEPGTTPAFDGRVVPWGASQGGHGALFLDRYLPLYEPGWTVPCVAAVVPPSNLAGQAQYAIAKLGSAAGMGIAFLAASHLWYDPPTPLSKLFNPDGPMDYSDYIPDIFTQTCSTSALMKGASCLSDIFTPGALEALSGSGISSFLPWGCFALENSLPTSSVPNLSTARHLIILGQNDELVDSSVERASVDTLCAQGMSIELVECSGLTHTNAALESINIQMEWLFECLADPTNTPATACTQTPPVTCQL